ncbi:MAG: hypothetical protein IJ781_02035 [Atopobiaceae bacterium]|nr:hypothetical protein [Atopobiaceae bacterium]
MDKKTKTKAKEEDWELRDEELDAIAGGVWSYDCSGHYCVDKTCVNYSCSKVTCNGLSCPIY